MCLSEFMWPNQANLISTKQPWPHLFLFSPKESVGCEWMHYFRDQKCPGTMVVVVVIVNTRRSRRSQSGEFDLCVLLWCGWFCSMWTNTLLGRKNFIFPPSFGNAYKVPFLPFLPSLFQNTYKAPFIPFFQGCGGIERPVHKYVWERECVFLLFLNHWRIFKKLKIIIN